MTPSEVSTALGLSALKRRTWAIFKTSALKGDGLEEAMEWCVSIMKCYVSIITFLLFYRLTNTITGSTTSS